MSTPHFYYQVKQVANKESITKNNNLSHKRNITKEKALKIKYLLSAVRTISSPIPEKCTLYKNL